MEHRHVNEMNSHVLIDLERLDGNRHQDIYESVTVKG